MMRKILIFMTVLLLMGCTPIQPVKAQTTTLSYQAAAKFLGEVRYSDESFFLLSCTVKNRLKRGWNPNKVMGAYYGIPRTPTPEMVEFVQDVLDNGACPPVYFAYSDNDIVSHRLRTSVEPIAKKDGVNYFTYEQYGELTNQIGT